MIFRVLMIVAVAFLAACSPVIYQDWGLVSVTGEGYEYSLNGYTELGETEPEDAERYAREWIDMYCQKGGELKAVVPYLSGNGFGEFLYWEAVVLCKNEKATS